jgi:hypothetical protein
LNQTLSPTNLIHVIRDEADRRTIKNLKPKKEGHDVAFVAGQSSEKGRKGNEESKKLRTVKCYNCKKLGHIVKGCWVPGGGAEGKGPKQKEKGDKSKGKGKEVAAKVEEKDDDNDGIWMAAADGENDDLEQVEECSDDTNDGHEMWTQDEISTESDIRVESGYQNSQASLGMLDASS